MNTLIPEWDGVPRVSALVDSAALPVWFSASAPSRSVALAGAAESLRPEQLMTLSLYELQGLQCGSSGVLFWLKIGLISRWLSSPSIVPFPSVWRPLLLTALSRLHSLEQGLRRIVLAVRRSWVSLS